jgi:hypothetical protein
MGRSGGLAIQHERGRHFVELTRHYTPPHVRLHWQCRLAADAPDTKTLFELLAKALNPKGTTYICGSPNFTWNPDLLGSSPAFSPRRPGTRQSVRPRASPDSGRRIGGILRVGLNNGNAVCGGGIPSHSRLCALQPLVQSSLLGWIFDGPDCQAL